MKNVFFAIAFMIGSLTFANTEVNKSSIDKSEVDAVSECCTVTLTHESTGDSVTVRACRTTTGDACRAAFKMASAAIDSQE